MKVAIVNLARFKKISESKTINKDLEYLNRWNIQYADYCFNEDKKERLVELFNKALVDNNIDIIWFAAGGVKTLNCIDFIDWESIKTQNKIFLWESDLTHLAIPLVSMGKTFYYWPSLNLSRQNPNFEDVQYVMDFLKTGKIKKYKYNNLLWQIEVLDESKIVWWHLILTSFMLWRHPIDLSNRYLFIEHHYIPGETTEELWYWLEQLKYTIKNNLPRGFVIWKTILTSADGGIIDIETINDCMVLALKEFNLPIVYLDHSKQIIKFS